MPGELTQELSYKGAPYDRRTAVPIFTDAVIPKVASHVFADADLYLDYPPIVEDEQGTAPAPPPKGMSGAGIWVNRVFREGSLWWPAPKLVGILRSASPTREWLRATQIQHWLRMVARNVPETAETIDATLRTWGTLGAD